MNEYFNTLQADFAAKHGDTIRDLHTSAELVVYPNTESDEPEIYFDDSDLGAVTDSGGLTTKGEKSHGHMGYTAEMVTLPWPILFELVDWKRKQEQS